MISSDNMGTCGCPDSILNDAIQYTSTHTEVYEVPEKLNEFELDTLMKNGVVIDEFELNF